MEDNGKLPIGRKQREWWRHRWRHVNVQKCFFWFFNSSSRN